MLLKQMTKVRESIIFQFENISHVQTVYIYSLDIILESWKGSNWMDIFGAVVCGPYAATGRYLNRTAAVLGGKHLRKFYQKYYETLREYY